VNPNTGGLQPVQNSPFNSSTQPTCLTLCRLERTPNQAIIRRGWVRHFSATQKASAMGAFSALRAFSYYCREFQNCHSDPELAEGKNPRIFFVAQHSTPLELIS